jgi:hypothetical protein
LSSPSPSPSPIPAAMQRAMVLVRANGSHAGVSNATRAQEDVHTGIAAASMASLHPTIDRAHALIRQLLNSVGQQPEDASMHSPWPSGTLFTAASQLEHVGAAASRHVYTGVGTGDHEDDNMQRSTQAASGDDVITAASGASGVNGLKIRRGRGTSTL